jgi:hypothetical protein
MWKKTQKPEPPRRSSWAATSVVTTKTSCEAARALKDQRFLAAEAPKLPLTACPSPESCPCTYRKHPDRRTGPRRDVESSGLRRYVDPAKDRRARRGRRQADNDPDE